MVNKNYNTIDTNQLTKHEINILNKYIKIRNKNYHKMKSIPICKINKK